MVESDPVNVLFIDYLQLMNADERRGNRNDELDNVLQNLQSLHKDHELQIILLSQLSRGVEHRRFTDEHARPEMQDLRDSGAIEQTADEILFLHREDYYREFKQNDGATELIIAKQRLGPTGTVRMTFIPEEESFV
jgi:replicative DNA helicase